MHFPLPAHEQDAAVSAHTVGYPREGRASCAVSSSLHSPPHPDPERQDKWDTVIHTRVYRFE